MKTLFFSLLMVIFMAFPTVWAQQDVPVNYGPEWETIKQSYEQITDAFAQKRSAILNDSGLTPAQRNQKILLEYQQFMGESRQLAARRSEIIKIAAERSGLKYTLGSDPAAGRGMAGDIDLGGSPAQAKKFMQELRNLGIADAFDNIHSIQSKPGYVSLKVPMDVTVNYEGLLGKVGSSAYETQIATDARSKETYLSVAMEQGQPGRKAVETLDHLRKARQGMKVPPAQMLANPESLQLVCKGTAKAMEVMNLSDPEVRTILKKSGLDMTPDQFRGALDKIRKGNNIAPELAGVNKENIKGLVMALDETGRVCQNKAVQSFQNEMGQARGLESTLRQSRDPAVRGQIPEARATVIDSTTRMRENLNALIEMDSGPNHGGPVPEEVKTDNKRLKLWMDGIEKGGPRKPAGPIVFGETKQFRLPGADTVKDLVSRGVKGYSNFRNNAKVNAFAQTGMHYAGGAMMGLTWYNSSKAQGDSDWTAAAKGLGAGMASLTRFGSLVLGAEDIYQHMTVKAEKYGNDQKMHYALMGLDVKDEGVQNLINTKMMMRRGVYLGVKTTSYSSMFLAHPALIVTGAALEAGLAVYEAYEEADLWERYAEQLNEYNTSVNEWNFQRTALTTQQMASQLLLQSETLNKAVASYHELIKEQESIAQLRKDFQTKNQAFDDYLQSLKAQITAAGSSPPLDDRKAQETLTTLRQVQRLADQYAGQISAAAAALQSDPDSAGKAYGMLGPMISEYQALNLQMEGARPVVAQLTAQSQITPQDSPVTLLAAYQEQLTGLQAMLQPRYNAISALMLNSKKIAEQMESLKKRRDESVQKMKRYEGYLARQAGPVAAEALTVVRAARSSLEGMALLAWQKEYPENLSTHYINIRDILDQAKSSGGLLATLYPEPIGSYYKNLQPQPLALSPQLSQQWQQSGAALDKFHGLLSALRSQLAGLLPDQKTESEPEKPAVAASSTEKPAEYTQSDSAELRNELARLKALRAELARRSEAAIAELNKAFFADRDALFKAYEEAFKTPQLLPCPNCGTDTLHSMDYSESPPSVWCNVCGRILSFSEWAGKGTSLKQIRTQGQAKKAEIQSQLAANQKSVDMAIEQVNAALAGK